MRSEANFIPSQVPYRCTSMTSRNCSDVIVRRVASLVMPALFTSTSTDPNTRAQCSISDSTSASEVTSHCTPITSAFAAASSLAAAAAASPLMSASRTRPPCPTQARAIASPIPWAAPVTTTVRSASSVIGTPFHIAQIFD